MGNVNGMKFSGHDQSCRLVEEAGNRLLSIDLLQSLIKRRSLTLGLMLDIASLGIEKETAC